MKVLNERLGNIIRSRSFVLVSVLVLLAAVLAGLIVGRHSPAEAKIHLQTPAGIEIYLDQDLTQLADHIEFGTLRVNSSGSVLDQSPIPVWIRNGDSVPILLVLQDDFPLADVVLQDSPQSPLLEPGQVLATGLLLQFIDPIGGNYDFTIIVDSAPVPNYTLVVDPGFGSLAGKVVSFRIAIIFQADQTEIWEQGGSTNLDLTALSVQASSISQDRNETPGMVTVQGGILASPSMQRVPPHVFTGRASIDGKLAPVGTIVSAWVDGVSYGATTVRSVDPPTSMTATEIVFGPLGDNFNAVWRFDNASGIWEFYITGDAFLGVNTLTDAAAGHIVWVNVTVEQGFQGTTLFPGWNLIALN